MNDCQGRGRVMLDGKYVATVEYSVHSDSYAVNSPIRGQVEVVEGEKSLSTSHQFTLHMEGSLELDFQIEPAVDQVAGKYQMRGISVFRKSP